LSGKRDEITDNSINDITDTVLSLVAVD